MPPIRSALRLASAALAGATLGFAAMGASIEANAPLKDFALPTFTPEGYRSMLVRGDEVKLHDTQRIDITQMQLTLFDGKADNRVDTVMISTAATFFPSRQFAQGDHGVRIVRDDVEMSGQTWTYDHLRKKVVIDGKVHVIFRAQLDAILQ